MRKWLVGLLFVLASFGIAQTEIWKQLPAPAAMPTAVRSGLMPLNGIKLYYAMYGYGQPLIFLHGGLGHSEVWGNQVAEFSKRYRVIVIDSRGHGRSTRDGQRYTYELMASDVVALMDKLRIQKADLVGWSDGAIIGLVMALKNPERLKSVFAYGANSDPSGLKDISNDVTFNQYIENMGKDYVQLSSTPNDYNGFLEAIGQMWATEPNITDQLGQIRVPITIADGEFDEAIKLEHTQMMAKAIPAAKLRILPGVSHFGMWQNPSLFNQAISDFLAGR